MSQRDAILEHLLSGKSITPIDALEAFGCFRLAAVIHDLRRDGYQIVTEDESHGGGTHARYWLPASASRPVCNPPEDKISDTIVQSGETRILPAKQQQLFETDEKPKWW